MARTLIEPVGDDQINMVKAMWSAARAESGRDPFNGDAAYFWLVVEDNKAVGCCGINSYDPIARRCRAMLYIVPEWRNKGVGKWAHQELNRILFDDMNMHKIEGVIESTNVGMMHLARSIGGTPEGQWVDMLYYEGRYHSYAQFCWLKE